MRGISSATTIIPFDRALYSAGEEIRRLAVTTVQVNVGKRCNQACAHCHVDAGPARTESMGRRTADRILQLLAQSPAVATVDITGGAPELNPYFRDLVAGAAGLGKAVLDRCNLTILLEPGQEDLPEFLAGHGVRIIASLPCYLEENVDRQRGRGVFEKSIRALRRLNALGYGRGKLVLDLVYNPIGAVLPPDQKEMEADYRERLRTDWGVEFTRLLALANMPIARFAGFLLRENKLEPYLRLLAENFNPRAAKQVMCASMVSVGWDGALYDCDFNQMLELPLGGAKRTLWDIGNFAEAGSEIAFDDHCYGCTAGAGSSCSGALT